MCKNEPYINFTQSNDNVVCAMVRIAYTTNHFRVYNISLPRYFQRIRKYVMYNVMYRDQGLFLTISFIHKT